MFEIDNIDNLLQKSVVQGSCALKTDFVSNDYLKGKKVISSIEDALRNCKEFYISVAFITRSGITPLLQALKELEQKNVKGYILTTDYLTFSEPEALEILSKLKNITLKMYVTDSDLNESKGGFHTKGYMFLKNDDSYDMIIGSSNLTLGAITTNKEWNTRVSTSENDKYVHDVFEEFKELWRNDFSYSYEEYKDKYLQKYKIVKDQRKAAFNSQIPSVSSYKLEPNKMQVEFIDNLKQLIAQNKSKALFISATGTGKTYASAFAMREINPKRGLFLVHREQIAKKSRDSYQVVFNGSKTLGIFSGSQKDDTDVDILFATYQTMGKEEYLKNFKSDHFDFIVIDEAHHIGAKTYQTILSYFKPKLLLGMTATPERSDDYDLYNFFEHNIVYEIRLQQALENDFLCPFHYFGITDINDDSDDRKLSDFRYLCREERVSYILDKVKYFGHSGDKVKGLIFCSRADEAKELSEIFNRTTEFKTTYLTGENSQAQRESAVELLESDDPNNSLDYIFSVDIFNEGIDIPAVNQVVMLRPTQSPIIFIQQLGRGLRKSKEKDYVVILDFIGNYNNNFMIPMALSGDRSFKRENYRRFVHEGVRIIPGASTIHFDEISKKKIFSSIDSTNFNEVKKIKENYKQLKQKLGRIPSIKDFSLHGEMDVQCIIRNKSLGSYYTFLKKYEPDYEIKLTALEEKYICFISQKFCDGKRTLELDFLNKMLDLKTDDLFKFYPKLTTVQKDSISNILTNNFITGTGAKSNQELCFATENNGELCISDAFYNLVKGNPDFAAMIKELIEYALDKNTKEYASADSNSLCLNKMYSYDDVCRLLYWDKSVVPLNIGGYLHDKKTNTFPIFINYHKSEDIASSQNYEDRFLDRSSLSWITKSKRDMTSPEVKTLMDEIDNSVKIEIFVRKVSASSKKSETEKTNDDAFKEFYYLGQAHYVADSAKQIMMKDANNKDISAVNMQLRLEEPVREDIFDYLVNK